jgi:putative Holliday junction resolvase
MGRILAIDYGTKRCGIAHTDPLQLIASGLTTVNTADLLNYLERYLEKEQVECIVVGEPLQKDGTPPPVEEHIQAFLEKLEKHIGPGIRIERQDERYSSKQAFQTLIDSGLKKKKRRDKALIDEISATIILQEYMERKS